MSITNEIISSYLGSFHTEMDPDMEELRSFAESKHIPVILRDTEDLLRILLYLKKPVNILEIGTAIGYSALFFAKSSDAFITTLERDEESAEAARENIRQMGYEDRICVMTGDACEILSSESFLAREETAAGYDFIFIDASKSHYRSYWDLAAPLCRDGGMIVCDNILIRGLSASDPMEIPHKHRTSVRNMRSFLSFLNGLEHVETCVLPVGDGMSVSVIDRERYEQN